MTLLDRLIPFPDLVELDEIHVAASPEVVWERIRHGELGQSPHFVAFGAPDEAARAAGKPWMAATWLFLVEPLGELRSRFISRFRVACSRDLATQLRVGPALLEPVGFTMDRKMLLGVKRRAESDAELPAAVARRAHARV